MILAATITVLYLRETTVMLMLWVLRLRLSPAWVGGIRSLAMELLTLRLCPTLRLLPVLVEGLRREGKLALTIGSYKNDPTSRP